MTTSLTYVESEDALELARSGGEPWRILADCDKETKQLAGNCWIRMPDNNVLIGHLADYRQLRGVVPHGVYLTLRQLKNTYRAEQSGLVGHA